MSEQREVVAFEEDWEIKEGNLGFKIKKRARRICEQVARVNRGREKRRGFRAGGAMLVPDGQT